MSAYADKHKADWVPVNYDEVIYNENTYDTYLWRLQQPYLRRLFTDITRTRSRVKYLDFACGTGRILSALEDLATEPVGLDTSPQMLERAQIRLKSSTLRCVDILQDPGLVDSDFDVITSFRFVLNTESDTRLKVLRSLAQHLAGPDSRLIFNIHGNETSTDALNGLHRQLRGWGKPNSTSYSGVQRLVEAANLEIESWSGYGLWPHRLYRSRFAPLLKWLDRQTAGRTGWRRISHDLVFVCKPRTTN